MYHLFSCLLKLLGSFCQVIAILDRLKDEKKNLQDEDLDSSDANEENIDCDEDDLDDEGIIYVK